MTANNDWIEWSGGKFPCPNNYVLVRYRAGGETEDPRPANRFDWGRVPGTGPGEIVAYKFIG